MSIICLEAPAWRREPGPDPALQEPLLELAPRVALEARSTIWGDGRGLDAAALARRLLERLRELGVEGVRAGVADTAVAARAAARTVRSTGGTTRSAADTAGAAADTAGAAAPASRADVRVVPSGTDRPFLDPLPLMVLGVEDRLLLLLDGVGVATCGDLARIPREAVEVRFGAEAVGTWRRARAEEVRPLFAMPLPVQPHASMDFVDYVVTDPERLVFTANALLGGLLEGLAGRGEHARALTLSLPLANGQTWRRTLRAARPTASRELWLRRMRDVLDRLTVDDAVAGMALRVDSAEPAGTVQGDLFDPGFATAGAAESAVARLLDTQGAVVVEAVAGAHPLAERRTTWRALDSTVVRERPPRVGQGRLEEIAAAAAEAAGGLTLQLLPDPLPVRVETAPRRDHLHPLRYHDGQWHRLETVAGPERVSGGLWEEDPYAREYFRGVNGQGVLVWLFRDAVEDRWFLHGWWD